MDPGDVKLRIDQAQTLFDTALDALRQSQSATAFPRNEIARLVMRARVQCLAAADPQDPGFSAGVLACNELLDQALVLAGRRSQLTGQQVHAMSAIERGQSILYFVAFRGPDGTPEGRPLSVRPRSARRSTPPPHPVPAQPSPQLEWLPPTAAAATSEADEVLRELTETLAASVRPQPLVSVSEPVLSLEPGDLEELVSSPPQVARGADSDAPELELGSLSPDALEEVPTAAGPPPPPQPQTPTRLTLETKVTLTSPTNFYLGFEDDLARGGLFVATYNRLRVTTPVTLLIDMPGGYVAHVHGVVRWVRDVLEPDEDSVPGLGVGFDGLGPEDRKAIQIFTGVRAPMFYDDET